MKIALLQTILLLTIPAFAFKQRATVINFYGDNGFRHNSQQAGVRMVEAIGKKNQWKVISTANPEIFNDKALASVQLLVFNNNCGNDGKIFNRQQQAAIKKFIERGGAFAGIHCAGTIWNEEEGFQRWHEALIAARMVAHPAVQKATMVIETQSHPATAHLPAYWHITDEYHTFTSNPRNKVNVLISVDEDSYTGSPKMQGDHPMVWCTENGKSSMFFSALGHTEKIYSDSDFQRLMEGGLQWAMDINNNYIDLPVKEGLLVDLNADKGMFLDDSARIIKWENQAPYSKARFFEKRDEGRKIPGSGCPALIKNLSAINGHNTVVFREQELLNNHEDAFDHLITGKGYTFFCIIKPYKQEGKLKDVNSFFGNLKNGGMYEGLWGGFADDNRVWAAPRNAITIGRWDGNNPFLCTKQALKESQYYLVMGKMEAGTDSANVYLMINKWDEKSLVQKVKINVHANASKLAIGQERDAVNHPGFESFDGEIARFLLYERPLDKKEMQAVIKKINRVYRIGR